ncbi:MAG: acyl-CoA dehydrogenase family protein [Alphaproteobacteria bacterium]|jgi:acyl-CoA dehydrogenase|nr:acyl-CoA dehydrogenase [Rhodospirillaceae bacterium]MDP6020450.1 acyl-CoA dehydrogenase family protein [Alphaproteobacteria bacterium]MDP6256026.1 acyl-CoA dehydrogenase family protein [Alphaproteobacteria bacterium]MDP7052728.1 acyl-CoA dehydrogenase family protein [Alphaproteobacteria bacterium]MDP7229846.1 acyl-CoA dehydrogenase family protein [Alphaproteobacteria bacterium]|tara:strand:+ start:5701 stop:6909 length:1209 start_codon:yes stop_codon:yes gene_type:complete
MIPEFSDRSKDLQERLLKFMDDTVYPNEDLYQEQLNQNADRWNVPPILEEMKAKAREKGLWNLFLPESEEVEPMSNLNYSPLCEIMGRSPIAAESTNCSAPDTGNMEVFTRYANAELKERWLTPLLDGKIRSAFAMTEPAVASSDATNIETAIVREGDEYVINGRKWWTSGIGDPRCEVLILMGKTDPDNADRYRQQSMIVVPRNTPGITVEKMLHVFGYDDAPHGHGQVLFENVRVPADHILLGEGRGFEIAQGRLGPGRIHHCMRQIGVAERALENMCKRAKSRFAFGKLVSEQSVTSERIAEARIAIDQARLLVLYAAHKMDTVGNKEARKEIAMIKVAVPNMTCRVVDMAMQVHGGGGVSQVFNLAHAYAHSRTLRFADGPDEVHRAQIGRLEMRRWN